MRRREPSSAVLTLLAPIPAASAAPTAVGYVAQSGWPARRVNAVARLVFLQWRSGRVGDIAEVLDSLVDGLFVAVECVSVCIRVLFVLLRKEVKVEQLQRLDSEYTC